MQACMLSIMKALHSYLGSDYKSECRVLSGGDQLTRERQSCAQRHVMDSDTPSDRLALVEPVIEDWHCMVVLLEVRYAYNKFYDVLTACACVCNPSVDLKLLSLHRLPGNHCFQHLAKIMVL